MDYRWNVYYVRADELMKTLYLLIGGCIVLLSGGLGSLKMFFITLAVILVYKVINRPKKEFTVPDRTSEFSVAFSKIARQGYTGYSVDTGCVGECGLSGFSGVPRTKII